MADLLRARHRQNFPPGRRFDRARDRFRRHRAELCNPFRHIGFTFRAAPDLVGDRMYVRSMSGTAVQEAIAALRVAHDALAAADIELLPRSDLVTVMDQLETLSCQLPT